MELELLRCLACHSLLLNSDVLKRGSCKCGARKVCGAHPRNLLEKIQVFIWSLTKRVS